jgi:hypothetical protein
VVMTKAKKNLWQRTATFEPLWNEQHGLIPGKIPPPTTTMG